MTCRANGCGCEATDGLYCAMCAQFTPICPVCNCPYGEHHPSCAVADGYDDSKEGPWQTRDEAEAFARAEVGVPWQVERGGAGQWFVMVKHED